MLRLTKRYRRSFDRMNMIDRISRTMNIMFILSEFSALPSASKLV